MAKPRPKTRAGKATSARKRMANRRNAKRSTGPKDTSRTRYNALKHGLLSQAAIIDRGDLEEDPRELEAIVARLWEDLQPVGAMEEMLVDIIGSCHWRRRRAVRAEVGAIRLAGDSTVDEMIRAKGERFLRSLDYEGLGGGMTGSWQEMITSSLGIKYLLDFLRESRALIEESGFLPEDQLKKVAKVLGRREGSLGDWLLVLSTIAAEQLKPETEDEKEWSITPEACKSTMLKLIDEELERLEGVAETAAEREKLELDATALCRHLPDSGVLDKNSRYETAIDRRMYRALNALMSLQAARLAGRIGERQQ